MPTSDGAPREWAADVTAALAGPEPSKAMKQIVADFRRVEVFSHLIAAGWSPGSYLGSEYKLRPRKFPKSVPAVAARAEGECNRSNYVRVGFEISATDGVGFGVPVATRDIHDGNVIQLPSDDHLDIDIDVGPVVRRALKARPSRHSWVWTVD